ncbi:MAG: hypothetical protein M1817_003117 [Caeruleum heppii]|nr:MAG: hypothetical protein M1817_003117 [Caeruleum heppii]
MAPRLHCVRHAQGHHNVGVSNYGIPDPLLTELGEKQCARLAQNYPYHSTTELLVSSPLRRTLYTTLLSFQTETDKGIKIIALPELQETSDLPCDTGSDLDVLTEEFMGKPVDLARVQKGWNSKANGIRPPSSLNNGLLQRGNG